MLTVIIAPEEYITTINENKLFLSMLSADENIIFCRCYYDADNIEEMVPDLDTVVANQEDWNAVIIAPDNRYNINPYDYTEYSEKACSNEKSDWDYYRTRRKARFECYEKAIENPLVALTSALQGTAYSRLLINSENFENIVNGNLPEYKYMLRKRLESLNVLKLAHKLENTNEPYLSGMAGESCYSELIDAIREMDCDKISDIIGEENVLEFNKFIGGIDPEYVDPEFTESQLFNYKKKQLLEPMEEKFRFHNKLPEQVLCIALRSFDVTTHRDSVKHSQMNENLYSRFVEFNLYPSRTQFLVYDILDEKDKRYHREFIKFLSTVLIVAQNKMPTGVVSGGYLYYILAEFDNSAFTEICKNYISKLHATYTDINRQIAEFKEQRKNQLDDKTAEDLFEKPIEVPVVLRRSVEEDDLKAHQRVGLSKNCPVDEETEWSKRSIEIEKSFVKYIREPKRAVKASVSGKFREVNRIKDDRILELSDYQLENVQFKLEEEEQKMAETFTERIFDGASYKKKMGKANNEIKREMRKRMTRKTTVLMGIVLLVLYFIGFVPFLIDNRKSVVTASNAFTMLIIAIGILIVLAIIVLFYYRYRLKKKFIMFDEMIQRFRNGVDESISQFSKYLGYTANVMRKYSVLNYGNKPDEDKIKALNKHKVDLEKLMLDTQELYSGYLGEELIYDDVKPYDYDYTILTEYEYSPCDKSSYKKIDYAHAGYSVEVPVNYLNYILVSKEDLYD